MLEIAALVAVRAEEAGLGAGMTAAAVKDFVKHPRHLTETAMVVDSVGYLATLAVYQHFPLPFAAALLAFAVAEQMLVMRPIEHYGRDSKPQLSCRLVLVRMHFLPTAVKPEAWELAGE